LRAVRSRKGSRAAWCGVAALLLPGAALARSSTYRLQVVRAEGAGTCPSQEDIERDVSQRLGRAAFSASGKRGVEVVLERAPDSGLWRARLYLRIEETETDSARVIESSGSDCSELGKAVTLAVALAIAPELPPELEPEPKPEPQALCPPPPSPPPPPPPPSSLHGTASARVLYSPNLMPNGTLGGALAVTVRGDLLGARFGALFYPENELSRGGTRLGFGLSAGFASGCLWARVREPEVWGCIGARAGALHTVVYSPDPVRPGDRFWWSAASELGLRATLSGRLFVEAGVEAVFPFVRHRFRVDAGSQPVYEQGPAAFETFLGIGLRLD
jgi:hypothetical protein